MEESYGSISEDKNKKCHYVSIHVLICQDIELHIQMKLLVYLNSKNLILLRFYFYLLIFKKYI